MYLLQLLFKLKFDRQSNGVTITVVSYKCLLKLKMFSFSLNKYHLFSDWAGSISFTRSFEWPWPQEFMTNPSWHLISTTWSGTNHVLKVFIDGELANTWKHSAIQSLSGGGWFGLQVPHGEAFPILLTSINAWNYVLSAEVIAAHVKSCDAAIGNIKEWYDAWPVLEEHSAFYTKPATCSAPILDPSRSEGVPSGDDLHQSSGMSLFVKSKKKKPSTKDGSKTHH